MCIRDSTNADYESAKAAFDAGANHAVHLFNAMPAFTHREPGVVGAVSDSEHVMAEIICDAVRMQSARFVTEPASAPSETRVARLPLTFTSSPPNVYCPSGIPVALMPSLINIIRSAPDVYKRQR